MRFMGLYFLLGGKPTVDPISFFSNCLRDNPKLYFALERFYVHQCLLHTVPPVRINVFCA